MSAKFALLAALLFTDAFAAERSVPILVYHRFGESAPMTVSTESFASQLAYLSDKGYTVVPLRSLLPWLQGKAPPPPPKVLAITADDGHRSVYSGMYPLLLRYHVPVTLFVYPSAIGRAKYALDWRQLREMEESGLVDVESHTYWHPDFKQEKKRLSPEAYRKFVVMQLGRAKSVLEEKLGGKVDLLAWPFGIHDDELEREAAASGYSAAFTIERRKAQAGDDTMALPRFIVRDREGMRELLSGGE